MQKEEKIKNQLKKLSEDFDFKIDPSWFKFAWISKRQEILAEFLSDCQDPIYEKYGKNLQNRIKNINLFINSLDFQKCCKRFGGSVYSRGDLKKYGKIWEKIKSLLVKKEIKQLVTIAEKKLKDLNYILILTKTKIKNEEQWLFKQILRHEWIHLLLYENKINFSDWRYNEGLNEYLSSFADKNLNDLEDFRDKEKYPYQKQYFIFAIKFRNWLKNCKTPRERKQKIKQISKELK